MKTIRFIMVGGFLGAGKTTLLSQLTKHYSGQGLKVGLVTNDQAQNLVDTNNLRSQGFAVEEVAGACFCCKFDELVSTIGTLESSQRPDIILAEPVGSCTDLVATVIQPMKDLYATRFTIAPYAVLFKPSHGLRILRKEESGFSPKAAYIFRKQLEEADAIVINRIDEIGTHDLAELQRLLQEQFPDTTALAISAKTGQNLDDLITFLAQDGHFGRKILDIDYDTYADGEAEMGWLNSSMHLNASTPFALDRLLMATIEQLGMKLNSLGGEVAHLKVIGLNNGIFGVANLVSNSSRPELSLASSCQVNEADMIVNARVAVDPVLLESEMRMIVERICQDLSITVGFRESQSLRPGRPTPTHRYQQVV